MGFHWWVMATIGGREYAHRFVEDTPAEARKRHALSLEMGWVKDEHERGWVSPLYWDEGGREVEVAGAAFFPHKGESKGGALRARYRGGWDR